MDRLLDSRRLDGTVQTRSLRLRRDNHRGATVHSTPTSPVSPGPTREGMNPFASTRDRNTGLIPSTALPAKGFIAQVSSPPASQESPRPQAVTSSALPGSGPRPASGAVSALSTPKHHLPSPSTAFRPDKLALTRRHEEPGSRDFRNRRLHPDSPLRVGSDVTSKEAKHPATRDVTFRASILPTQEDLTPPSGTGPRLARWC